MIRKKEIKTIIVVALAILISSTAMARGRGFKSDALAYFFLNKQDFKLEQAIQKLESESKGKVVVAHVGIEDDQWIYRLKKLEDGDIIEVELDPGTQQVIDTETEWFTRYDDDEYQVAINNAKISIGEAVKIAIDQTNGVAVSARFMNLFEQSAYQVTVTSDNTVVTIYVDADSGETIKLDDNFDKRSRRHWRHH